jgi:hypothetical protein
VRQISLIFSNYKGEGDIFVDYVRHQGDDSLVILPEESLFDTTLSQVEKWDQGCFQTQLPVLIKP